MWYLRVFDVLDSFLLVQDPVRPGLETVGHASKDDLGDLQSGVTQTHCGKPSSAREYFGPAPANRTVLHLSLRSLDVGHLG